MISFILVERGKKGGKRLFLRGKWDVCLDFEANTIFQLLVFSVFQSVTTLLCEKYL